MSERIPAKSVELLKSCGMVTSILIAIHRASPKCRPELMRDPEINGQVLKL